MKISDVISFFENISQFPLSPEFDEREFDFELHEKGILPLCSFCLFPNFDKKMIEFNFSEAVDWVD